MTTLRAAWSRLPDRVSVSAPAALLVVLQLQAACGRTGVPEGYRRAADLAAELAVAEMHREVGRIDVGTPGARAHLGDGWSWNERTPEGEPFAWGVGEASELRFFLVAPRELELRLRGWPLGRPERTPDRPPELSPQTVEVRVNGRRVERLELEPGPHTYAVTLPEAALVSGDNRLTLRYGRAVSPRELGLSDDGRALAVAWTGLRLAPMAAGGPEPAMTAGSVGGAGGEEAEEERAPGLRLPFGSAVDYFLEVPGARSGGGPIAAVPVLTLEALRSEGTGFLAIEVQEEGEETIAAGRLEPSERRTAFRLPTGSAAPSEESTRLIRLGLRAVPAAPGADGALELIAPGLSVPAVDAEPSERPAEASTDPGLPSRPNLLIYLVDTLRADRVGVYGGPGARRSLTPAVDAFAAEAVVFDDAVAEAPWTRPTVATLLTGLRPLEHGVTTLEDRLADDALTLPEILGAAGYRTAAFSTNWHVTETTGMAQGFEDFVFTPDDFHADAVNRRVIGWLDRNPTGGGTAKGAEERPFFLYVHTLDPHAPYEPPAPFRGRYAPDAPPEAGSRPYLERIYAADAPEERAERARLMEPIFDLYDGEAAYTDRAFGELLAALRERGLFEETLMVFVADHGEGLDEHGHLGHGIDLYREVLRIPLILRLPGPEDRHGTGRGVRVAETARQIDLLPTLLARLGIEPPAGLPGRDLLGGGASADHRAFGHLDYEGRRGLSVVLGEWKAIEPLSAKLADGPELYHRRRDPGELTNLATERPVRLGYLRTVIRRHLLETGETSLAEDAELDPETRRGLEALGYL